MRAKTLGIGGLLVVSLWAFSSGSATLGEARFTAVIPPTNISETAKPSDMPRIAVDGSGAIFVVWSDSEVESNPDEELEIAGRHCLIETDSTGSKLKCDDQQLHPSSGQTGGLPAPTNLSNSKGNSKFPDLVLTAPGQGLVVWQDGESGAPAIFLRQFSLEQGTQQQDPKIIPAEDRFTISERGLAAGKPAIATDNQNRLFVVWEQEREPFNRIRDIFFRASTDFSPSVDIFRSGIASKDPALVVDQARIFVVWQEGGEFGGNSEIFLAGSRNAGNRFEQPRFNDPFPANVSGPNSPGESKEPVIVVEQPGVQLVVWSDKTGREDNPDGDFEIFLRRSTEGFAPPVNVSGPCEFIDLDGNTIKTDGTAITESKDESAEPAVVADPFGNVYVAWREKLNGQHEIAITTSASNFRDPDERRICTRLSDGSGGASSPAFAIDRSGNVLAVWQQGGEIYLAALKLSNN